MHTYIVNPSSENLDFDELGRFITGTARQHWVIGTEPRPLQWSSGYLKFLSVPDRQFLTSEACVAAGANVFVWDTTKVLGIPLTTVIIEEPSTSAEPQREVPTYPVVAFDDARALRETLEPGLEAAVRRVIDESRRGTRVATLQIRRATEPEDPTWEELVYDVRVHGTAEEAMAYWDRIGDTLQALMDSESDAVRYQLANLVSVHVDWS